MFKKRKREWEIRKFAFQSKFEQKLKNIFSLQLHRWKCLYFLGCWTKISNWVAFHGKNVNQNRFENTIIKWKNVVFFKAQTEACESRKQNCLTLLYLFRDFQFNLVLLPFLFSLFYLEALQWAHGGWCWLRVYRTNIQWWKEGVFHSIAKANANEWNKRAKSVYLRKSDSLPM